jgi:hypothetical protein
VISDQKKERKKAGWRMKRKKTSKKNWKEDKS